VLKSLTPGQQVVKIVHEELVRMLGGKTVGLALRLPKPPTIIMLAGPPGLRQDLDRRQLASLLRRKGQRPLLVAADPAAAPAAIRQLQVLGEQAKVAVHAEFGARPTPVAVVGRALEEGRRDAGQSSSSTPPAGCTSIPR